MSALIELVRGNIQLHGYSLSFVDKEVYLFSRTSISSRYWRKKIEKYLTYLATQWNVSVNTQKVVLNSLVYLFERYLKREVGDLGFKLASKHRNLPIVLSKTEFKLILDQLRDRNRLIIELLYGSGLTVEESLNIRLQDIDIDRKSLVVRNGKGRKDK